MVNIPHLNICTISVVNRSQFPLFDFHLTFFCLLALPICICTAYSSFEWILCSFIFFLLISIWLFLIVFSLFFFQFVYFEMPSVTCNKLEFCTPNPEIQFSISPLNSSAIFSMQTPIHTQFQWVNFHWFRQITNKYNLHLVSMMGVRHWTAMKLKKIYE